MSLEQARNIAYKKKLINNDNELKYSTRKGKRFMILHNDKWIHFGAYPFTGFGSFLDHGNEELRKQWKARHSKIMKDGEPAYKNKSSPSYYSYNILW